MSSQFTETMLATRLGDFNIRVYQDAHGQETVVLSTPELDPTKPILVRIHSECLTGDTLGSLHCDCGEQLQQSRMQIKESGNGALIYLRQEGRGIGLFEKIKTYQLQGKGYDTHEANVMLGHRPDERTYEKAKMALDDLGVKQIRLLTNNPSKVSEIAKHQIEVVERVPLIIEANSHNKRYFASKKDKFKHFFDAEISKYFYQFHADNADHVIAIGDYLKNRKHDPLLKICVGISADNTMFADEAKKKTIRDIFEACEAYEDFVPVLHFSFRASSDPLKDIAGIKEALPYIMHCQTNDLPDISLKVLQAICNNFRAYIPLCDASFEIVHGQAFRDTIKENKAFVMLDNSKGRGISESKDALMQKTDVLLKYGINDIALCGGFGPGDLSTYLELRKYYKINFSIDAETKLKTAGAIDIEKTKSYLSELYAL
jgi:GTP cyclohydrolase II